MIEALASLDRSLFLILNSLHTPWLDPVMVVLSGQLIWTPLVLYCLWCAWRSNGKKGAVLFALFLIMAIIASDVTSSYIIKNLTERLRPCRDEDLRPLIYFFGQRCGGKFGFVSSHAANSFALVLYSLTALGLGKKHHLLLYALPLVVSYSRIYLGVHYPGDVLAGAAVGIGWGLFLAWGLKNGPLRREP